MTVQPHTVYTGRSTNWAMIALTTALVLPLLVLGIEGGGTWLTPDVAIPLAIVVGAVAVNVLTASSVRATAGPRGLTVHFGVFGWPRFRYAIDRIASAEAITIPSSHLAWGIHWTPRKGLMLTLRTGPALHLVLTSGRKVTISTPDPHAAVQTLNQSDGGLHVQA